MKKVYNASINIMTIGLVLWALETIVFLFIEGWHYKSTNGIEIILDIICQIIMRIGWWAWLLSAASLLDKIYENIES